MVTQNKNAKSRLGTTTDLPDTFAKLDKLGNVLKSNNDKGLRDNYTLAEISKNVTKIYEQNKKYYARYIKKNKSSTDKNNKLPSFDRNLFCQNILDNHSIVKKTIEYGSIINTNIAHCSDVWTCPVCASLIQTRRADEVQTAVDWATDNGYKTVMVTFTASHTVRYTLNDFGTKLQKAYEKMHNQLRHYRKKYEVGSIKSVEFTYSQKNGWHKHFHVIYFFKSDTDIDNYFAKIKKSWEHQCLDIGLLESSDKAIADFRRHGCTLTTNIDDAIATYANKSANDWRISDEMTKSVLKIGKSVEHMSPFQLLVNIGLGNNRDHLIDKFIEYMLHTKNAHQIDWSCGLKSKVGIDDKTNDELMDDQTDKSINVAVLTVMHWHLLMSKYLRIEYLKAAKDNGLDGIIAFFDKYTDSNFPDVLGKDDADLLASYDDSTSSDADKARYEILQTVLTAISDAFKLADNAQDTYITNRYKQQYVDILTTDEKKSILANKQHKQDSKHIPVTTSELMTIKNKCKSVAENNRKKALKRYIPKYEQTKLI